MCEAIYTYAIEKHNFMVDLNLPKLIEQSKALSKSVRTVIPNQMTIGTQNRRLDN